MQLSMWLSMAMLALAALVAASTAAQPPNVVMMVVDGEFSGHVRVCNVHCVTLYRTQKFHCHADMLVYSHVPRVPCGVVVAAPRCMHTTPFQSHMSTLAPPSRTTLSKRKNC
jgi:hypothetical protein